MGRLEHYIYVGKERLRCGYTTGTCATAAARGAAEKVLCGMWPEAIQIETPAGISVTVRLEQHQAAGDWASCGVRKDGGDDPDITHGILICAKVRRREEPGIVIDGGPGVGRVTMPGLDQGVGCAAINSVPRKMIREQLEQALEENKATCGLEAEIFVPEGEKIAAKTFNPRLGIQGGISILGTSGIVRPMSEDALIQSLYLEQDALYARGVRDLLVTPGNYGEDFARDVLNLRLDCWALCSNYVGAAIDHAAGLGFHSFLLVGHLGKLVKVAGGAMNTHSKAADGRRETLAAHTALCGGSQETVRRVFACPTTDAAISVLEEAGIKEPVLASIALALGENLHHRAGEMEIEALFFSNQYGILGKTPGADRLLSIHKGEIK